MHWGWLLATVFGMSVDDAVEYALGVTTTGTSMPSVVQSSAAIYERHPVTGVDFE